MFLVEHEDEGNFVYCVFIQQFSVPLLHNLIALFYADGLQCVEQVALWNCLYAEHVVGVEDCFEVLLLEEGLGELIDIFIVGVFLLEVLFAQRLQHLQHCRLRVFGSLIKEVGH